MPDIGACWFYDRQSRNAESEAARQAEEKIGSDKVENTVHFFLLLSPIRQHEQIRYHAAKGFKQVVR